MLHSFRDKLDFYKEQEVLKLQVQLEEQAQAAISGAASIDETIESRVKMQVDLVRHRVLDEKEMSKALRTMSVFRSSQGDLEASVKELEARLREAQSSRALTESNFRAVAREFEELQLAIKLKQKHDELTAQSLTTRRNKSLHKALSESDQLGGSADAASLSEAEIRIKQEFSDKYNPKLLEIDERCEAALKEEEAKQQQAARKKAKELMAKLNEQYNQHVLPHLVATEAACKQLALKAESLQRQHDVLLEDLRRVKLSHELSQSVAAAAAAQAAPPPKASPAKASPATPRGRSVTPSRSRSQSRPSPASGGGKGRVRARSVGPTDVIQLDNSTSIMAATVNRLANSFDSMPRSKDVSALQAGVDMDARLAVEFSAMRSQVRAKWEKLGTYNARDVVAFLLEVHRTAPAVPKLIEAYEREYRRVSSTASIRQMQSDAAVLEKRLAETQEKRRGLHGSRPLMERDIAVMTSDLQKLRSTLSSATTVHKSLFGESVAVEAVEAAAVTTTNDVQPTRSRKLPIAKLLAAAKLASSASSVRNYSADTTFPPSDDPLPNPNARAAILDVAGFSESELVTPRSQQAESVETVVDTARDGQPQPAVPSGDLLANIESY